jgi:DNA primase
MGLKNRMRAVCKTSDDEDVAPTIRGLDDIANDLDNRPTSQRLYDFFVHPVGKKPTNITAATVDHFGVFERTWGYYADRALIPYMFKGELVGFVAIDLLGEEEWTRQHPLEADDLGYRKTLYPLGFSSATCLGGYDNCTRGCEQLFIVEDKRSAMKMWQEGYPNTVSLNGSMLHQEQMELISLINPREICVMMDGDKVGRMATDKVAAELLRHFPIRKCFPPWGLDPKNLNDRGIENVVKKSKRLDIGSARQ